MTYRYCEVRREVYNRCSGKAPNKYRSFSRMKKLFKRSCWALLLVTVGSIILFFLLAILIPEKPYSLIPAPIPYIAQLIFEVSCDKLYNAEERKLELTEIRSSYEAYIQELREVLSSCGIDSAQKRKNLKAECNACLEMQTKPYSNVSSNAYNMLIGVPLGAAISTIIYQNRDGAAVTKILSLIMVGLIIIGLCKVFKTLSYYRDGHFKDRYLLEVLNELEYIDD